jgi:hypothetical protein
MDDELEYWKGRSDYSLISLKIVDHVFYEELSSPLCVPRREQFFISAVSQIFMLLADPEQMLALPPPVVRKICSYDRSRIINIFLTRDLRPSETRRLFFARSSILVQGYQIGMEIGSFALRDGSYISRANDMFYHRAKIYIDEEGCFTMSILIINKISEDFFIRSEKPEDDLSRRGTEIWRQAFDRFRSQRPVTILGRNSDLTTLPAVRY